MLLYAMMRNDFSLSLPVLLAEPAHSQSPWFRSVTVLLQSYQRQVGSRSHSILETTEKRTQDLGFQVVFSLHLVFLSSKEQ